MGQRYQLTWISHPGDSRNPTRYVRGELSLSDTRRKLIWLSGTDCPGIWVHEVEEDEEPGLHERG